MRNISAVSFVFIFCLLTACSHPETQYFIGTGPIFPYYMGPFGVVIYKVDGECDSLRKVWSLPEQDYYRSVMLYPKERVVVIIAEPLGYKLADRIYVVPFDSVLSVHAPILDYREISQTLKKWPYLDNGDGRSFLSVETAVTNDTIIDLSTYKAVNESVLSPDATERLMFSGDGWHYGEVETRHVPLVLRGVQWIAGDYELQLHATPIPDSIVKMKTSYGWNLFLNESEFFVLQSVPDRNGLTSRELLIFNRLSGVWNSVLVPGAVTRLKLLGSWLGGVVMDDDPGADYVRRFSGPPVPREEVVLVDPHKLRSLTVHLGERCDLLSIEEDVVFYRIKDELYRAKIDDHDFVDRQLVLKDMQVSGMLASFKGWDCAQSLEPCPRDSVRFLRFRR